MRQIPAPLQAHLDRGATTIAYCWKIVRKDGQVFGFTEHDRDLSFDSVTYKADSGFMRSRISASLGLAVDNLDVAGALRSDDITEDDISRGLWDQAEVTLYGVNWADTAQRWIEGRGQLGQVTRGLLAFQAEIRSLADRLQQKTGRVYHFFCNADLGDPRCKIDLMLPSFRSTGTVGAAPTKRIVILSGVTGFAAGWFSNGLLEFTSGALDGFKREIKQHSIVAGVHYAEFWEALPDVPIAGDSIVVTAGCDKLWATCKAKFDNRVNFRGFPHMPGDDRITAYPRAGEKMDGGSLFDTSKLNSTG